MSARTKRAPTVVGARPAWAVPADDAAWMVDGACRQVPVEHADWWWPETPQDPHRQRGKDICDACPVAAQCLAYAEDARIAHGTWGGLDEWERAWMRRERQRPDAGGGAP